MFNPTRLILARKRRRLTGKALADLIKRSPVTISRLENGNNEPEPETVDLIARALGFPRKFFMGADVDDLSREAASFRSLTAMTATERDAALAAGSIAYMVVDWVNARFNLPQPDLLDLSAQSDPANAARSLRQYWGLGEQPVTNMVKLLEAKGARVFSLAENTRNLNAFSCWRNDTPFIFLNTLKSSENSRFDAAHELGHLVIHKHGGPHQGRNAEDEANAFASSFLMPRADVLSRSPRHVSLNDIISLKSRWGVSVAALAYRLHKLGLVTDWQYRSLCIEVNRRGYRMNEPNGIQREESVVWKKVFTELWSDRITKDHVAMQLNVPPEEIENLMFGLVGQSSPPPSGGEGERKPGLRLVVN